MRGAFIGLGSDHTIAHLCRAVLEGVAYSPATCSSRSSRPAAVAPSSCGRAAAASQSDLWCQIKADVLDRPIARLVNPHSGCLGAALMAASGSGLVESVRAARAGSTCGSSASSSRRPRRGVYDELYALYRDAPAGAAAGVRARSPSSAGALPSVTTT